MGSLTSDEGEGSIEFGLVVLAIAVAFTLILFVFRPDFEGIINSIQQAIQGFGASGQ